MKWTTSSWMYYIHVLGTSVVDYVISNIPIYNQILNFDFMNLLMHKTSIEENNDNQRHLLFDKNKVDIFLKHLNSESNFLSYKNNFEDQFWRPLS